MVRLKNRYLLVNILYPEIDDAQSKSKVPDLIAINQPTTNALTQHILLKHLRSQISELFGDYGSGAVSDSLQGNYLHFLFYHKSSDDEVISKIPFQCDLNIHTTSFASTIPASVGSIVDDEQHTNQKRKEMCL